MLLGVLYYLGLRRGEALGLKWGDFDWKESQVHIQRDIDFAYSTAREGALKTEAADRFVPVPLKLRKMLLQKEGESEEYVFHDPHGNPLSQATFKRMWCRLMADARCATVRDYDPHAKKNWDILKQ
ncbi:MAG: tyrosine-type recombinase/integrase, partial [Clostridia bacterium]|nr:tyrosine-type recombinase/integrase [Clostridia bacterium]